MSAYTTRREILRQARGAEHGRTERSVAVGVWAVRIIALLGLLGLLVAKLLE